jgi:hypothetical protein
MTSLAPFICGACRNDRHYLCRPDFACECPHQRGTTPVPAAAPASLATLGSGTTTLGVVAGEAGGATEEGEAEVAPPPAVGAPLPAAGGALVTSPAFWGAGEDGCRFADADVAHRCLSVFGFPLRAGQVCHEEARAGLAEMMDAYRQVAS